MTPTASAAGVMNFYGEILLGAEDAVACIAQTGDDVAVLVQLFQPTAYNLGGLVIPGNPQHLAFGGTGIHKQIQETTQQLVLQMQLAPI